MTNTRTDIHRPSSPAFDPEAYEFVACGDNGSADERPDTPLWAVQDLRAKGAQRFLSGTEAEANSGQCTHCGAHLRFYAIMLHVPTNEWIYVGETCLDNRFENMTAAEFKRLRESAKLNRERTAKASKIEALVAAHPLLADITYVSNFAAVNERFYNEFLSDIGWKLLAKGELSDRQIDAAERAYNGTRKFAAAIDASEARKAADVASGTLSEAPLGRQQFTGTVVFEDTYTNDFGVVQKMRVKADEGGWTVFVSVPASIGRVEKGDRVAVSATLVAGKDAYSAKGLRPGRDSHKIED